MAYTRDGIMAQIWIAFGQGAGLTRVSQAAAMELHRWYFGAITPEVVDVKWETDAGQVLERIRAIGSLASLKAISAGATTISAQEVYESAATVQETSMTPLCPPQPDPLS
jgi:methionyl-tRNA formyltransferase